MWHISYVGLYSVMGYTVVDDNGECCCSVLEMGSSMNLHGFFKAKIQMVIKGVTQKAGKVN